MLLSLNDRFAANTCISSGQPQSYYELVLRNQTVGADKGDKFYRDKLKQVDGIMAVTPPPSPEPLAVEDEEFDGAVADIPAVPFPACKPIHGTPSRSC